MISDARQAPQAAPPQPLLACWCGSGPWLTQFRSRRFGLARCGGCGSYQIDPPPLTTTNVMADFYTEYYTRVGADGLLVEQSGQRTGDFWEVAAQSPQLRRVKRRVLEVGCGLGHRCAQLKALGWPEVIGCDISESRLARAREVYPYLRLECRPATALGLEPGSIDLLVMEHIIEHLPDPLAELRALRPLMAPDSSILLSTPNMASGAFRFLGRRWTGMLAPHMHIFLFSPETLSLLLVKAGFEVSSAGSLQKPFGSPLRRLRSGEWYGAAWQLYQEIGTLTGRVTGAGPIAYAIGRRV